MYDTKTARWLVQDPLAEKYYSYSSYNYCVNNPVMFVDPDEMCVYGIDVGPAYYSKKVKLPEVKPYKVVDIW